MKSKPKAKRKLVIDLDGADNREITVYTPVEEVASVIRDFGAVSELADPYGYALKVSPIYDLDEVVDYLGSLVKPKDKQEE
jgi:hypothetical protein